MGKVTEAQLRAMKKYDAEHTVQVKLKLNKKTDEDIIAALAECGNKQGFIKAALREYIAEQE